ncbi:MAG TPA: hypothetical protein VHM19_12965, partial [Polyangiales bacterium]|nr:hypothetical protein [Polyangiales bacterium]
GGHDGTSATNTLLRTQILDPLAGPEVQDLDASLGDGKKGLGKGLWFYRVSALFPASDASNPSGESLAGELLPVQLPDRDEKIWLTLTWSTVPGASGYRVYRSPAAGASADALELVGEVGSGSTLSFTDKGATSMASVTPLPAGSLGTWHAVDGARCNDSDCQLGTAREALATVAIANPADATQYFLYAFGGRDASGTYLDTYELATVHVASDGSQTVDDWTAGSDTLSSPRAELGVWVMDRDDSSTIRNSGTPGDVWVFVGGGRTSAVAHDRGIEAGLLQTDGTLGTFTATDPLKGDLAGFGAGAANNQLYTFGGIAGASDGTSASLCAGGGGCAALPDLQPGAFNALGSATTQRIYGGSAQESAFFFLAGGHDGNNTLATSEQTVQ